VEEQTNILSAPAQPNSVNRKLKLGIYRHYKGNMYHVHGVSTHSESLEKLVVYRCLYGERGLWVRPLDMFLETVEIDGVDIPRFEWQREATEQEIAEAISPLNETGLS